MSGSALLAQPVVVEMSGGAQVALLTVGNIIQVSGSAQVPLLEVRDVAGDGTAPVNLLVK